MSYLARDMTPHVTWRDITPGCNIYEGGTSCTVETGDWRTLKPVIDWGKCKQCLLCAPVCPDMSILSIRMENGKTLIIFSVKAAVFVQMPAPLGRSR